MIALGMGLGFARSRAALRLYDPDAAAFFAAAGIADASQKLAVNQLVKSLKAAGIWSRMAALYPFVGAAATPHSFNLRNSAQYRMTWHGTVTHDAHGIAGDGATGYGDTGLMANTALFVNNLAFGFYNRTTGTASTVAMGANDGAGNGTGIFAKYLDSNSYFDNTEASARISFATGANDEQGLQISSRTSSSAVSAYQKGALKGSNTNAQGTLPESSFLVLTNAVSSFSARNLAMAFVSTGLTLSDVTALNAAVVNFETALGRNV